MATPMDFPSSPATGQKYTAPNGQVYVYDGVAWTVGYYDSNTQHIGSVGEVIEQVRTLLQDTDNVAGQYRYSTDSLITNLNQCMMELFRLRPDLFLEVGFVLPVFNTANLDVQVGIEPQYMPAIVYYVVGLTQARDDEQNQDSRATGFLKVFQSAIVTGTLG
jgi:hypothetical protein